MPATTGIRISAIRFDNEPFVRTLTATVVNQLSARLDHVTDFISWDYPNDPSIRATTPSGSAYTIGQVASAGFIGTLYFYVTGRTYDTITQSYTLLTQTISATYRTALLGIPLSTVNYTLVYDTFPEIPNPALYLNYENTNYSSLFYRPVSSTPFNFILSAAIDEKLINRANFLSATNNFANSTAWVPASVSVQNKVYFGPDVRAGLSTTTADLIIPLSGTPYDQIASISNLGNTNILRPPGIYNITSNNYTVTSPGSGAIFEVGVSLLSAVSSVNIVRGGQGYRINDLITIQNTAFPGLNVNAPKLYFNVLTVNNNIHELRQTVSLSAGINTFSVYAYPSGLGGQYVYFRTNKHGNIIFDLYGRNAFNYGSWYNGEVTVTTPNQFGLSAMAVGNNFWLRCFATLNLSSDDRLDYSIGLTTDFSNISSDINSNYPTYLWGAQIEPRSFSTTYIQGPSSQATSRAWFTFNERPQTTTIPLTSTRYASLCSFARNIPCLSSVQFYISANTSVNSLTSWYTPHIFTTTISARFVDMLSADFVGYTKTYFNSTGLQIPLLSSNYTTGPGLCFYGENHTERITLSATKQYPNARYIWSFGDPQTNIYEISSFNNITNTVTLAITSTTKDLIIFVPSRIGYYPRIPINLLVTDQNILSSGPLYQFNDTTGYLEPYPFYYSTSLTLSNGVTVTPYENPNNNIFKQSIQVNSYAPPATAFRSSLSGNILLPVNFNPKTFFGQLKVALSGGNIEMLDDCYDRYNIVWKWSNLSAFSPSTSSTFFTKPSSWAETQCFLSAGSLTLTAQPGRFSKKWRRQGFTLTNIQKQPEFYTPSNLFWTLSSPEWSIVNINPYTETTYNFPLQYLGDGTSPFTASINNNTPVTLQASQTVTCVICAEPYDWSPKDITITEKISATVLSKGNFRFYTPNRLTLTGIPVRFENLSTGFNSVSSITIDLNNNTQITLTGSDVYNNFATVYNDLGRKTITVIARYTTGEVYTERFNNIINVVPKYDEVDTDNYRTAKTALQLPWPDAPYVGSNDWVTEDNINSVIRKFYENLEYLEDRGRSYYDEPMEFYGWLGLPPQGPADCPPTLTWNESECAEYSICTADIPISVCTPQTPLSARKVWSDMACLSPDTFFEEITANGKYYRCATWNDQYCDPRRQNPNCFGKFGIEWKWKYRKGSNTTKVVPWKYTRKGGFYEKKWIYEPFVSQEGETIIGLNCNEGYWNVNIPKLNTDYDPITKCTESNNCIYTSILVKDDLIFTSYPTEIKVLSAEYDPRFVAVKRTIDDFFSFRNIRNIAFDSQGKLFVLDGALNKVASYFFDINSPIIWEPFITWGGFGSAKSNLRFSRPNDMHVDQFDNVWVADTGNRCIKHYTNSGSWIQTIQDSDFQTNIPLSIVVDSASQVHVLLLDRIRVYSYKGEFLFEYPINDHDGGLIFKLSVNNIREIIYTVSNTQVGKYFKNGAFAGFVVDNKKCFTTITGAYQDKNRNVLITSGEKIGKFVDPMRTRTLKGPIPEKYWSLNSLLIHKDEYVQDWVYNKTFQRLWDNIELFRHSLVFETQDCNKYTPPVHDKNKILIGQNEIVTSTVVNRVISYLWDNFQTLVKYFDPACILQIEEQEKQKQKSLEEITLTTTTS